VDVAGFTLVFVQKDWRQP